MIYLFAGDDAKNKRSKYEKFITDLSKGVEVFSINKNDFDEMSVESLYSGRGLFFSKCVVIFLNISEKESYFDFLLKHLSFMQSSENDFVFLEGKLNKPVLDLFKKNKAEISLFELPKEAKEKFNNFLLANALGARDKKNLWIYYRQAVDRGVIPEELVGVMFWKVKDMLLKKNYGKFTEVELKKITGRLSIILPEARGSGRDAEMAFEKYLLEIF